MDWKQASPSSAEMKKKMQQKPLGQQQQGLHGQQQQPQQQHHRHSKDAHDRRISELAAREMDEFRSISIGSPIPTALTQDDDILNGDYDSTDNDFPAIKIENYAATLDSNDPSRIEAGKSSHGSRSKPGPSRRHTTQATETASLNPPSPLLDLKDPTSKVIRYQHAS